MMRGLFFLLAVCTLTAAMVPRERRALNTEEEVETDPTHRLCAEQTPCKWIIYNPSGHKPLIILNTYCTCSKVKECVITEINTSNYSDVYRCRAPGELAGESSASQNS